MIGVSAERLSPPYTLMRQDWSLHRKGSIDQARHNQKVKEAIRENLPGIIGEEAIITSDGKQIVKIPIRSLDLPRFRYDRARRNQVGQGSGGSQKGDVIGQQPGQAPGKGPGAGELPGIDYYEAELTIDDLAQMVFEDLGLPNLEERGKKTFKVDQPEFDTIRKKGTLLDKRRTLLENLRRNAKDGNPHVGGFQDDDKRFKTWEDKPREESSAVVIAMRDVSGSMGEFEKYITRSFYFWMVRFLRKKYTNVDIVFITHHTEAKEVDEETFFRLGESGGTKVSSAYQFCLDLVEKKYPISEWNVYPFHFSDGDNWGEADNQRCVELVRKLLALGINAFGYGEIQQGKRGSHSTLMGGFKGLMEGKDKDPRFIGVTISSKEEVLPALQRFFNPKGAS